MTKECTVCETKFLAWYIMFLAWYIGYKYKLHALTQQNGQDSRRLALLRNYVEQDVALYGGNIHTQLVVIVSKS